MTTFSPRHGRELRRCAALLSAMALGACGGGGGDDGTEGNAAPTVNAGADVTVFESTAVVLNGSGSDANGDPLTFSWTQTAGPAVTINNASSAAAGFTAPDVAAGAPQTLTFQLEVSDGTASRTDTVNVRVEENEPPVANAGADTTEFENTLVTLDGSASSDPNTIGTLSFAWQQTGGVAVTLTGADTAMPAFTAPDVAPGGTEVLDFELTVSDGVNNATDTVTVTVEEGAPFVTVSGTVQYQFVPPNPNCNGLNFLAIQTRPIRAATVQLIDAGDGVTVLDSTVATDNGDYAFAGVPAGSSVFLRVLAELKNGGALPNWDVEVRDNVDTSGSPPPLASRPLYAVAGSPFDTGGTDVVRDLTATTGWGGASYTGPRAAAPFAILDAIYSGMQLVLTADPNANFPALDAYWSVNNTLVSPSDIDAGELSASFYTRFANVPSLFLLGDANTDTEEFDDHVVVHEWGHYFEDNFSRSDSIGGPHALGQTIDARLAFGEGWATALAAMALGPQYCDTGRPGTTQGFGINAESGGFGLRGWYNEVSVVHFLYDLFDTTDDGTDTGSIGFQPIFDTMVGPQAATEAFTTVFSFAAELKSMLNAQDNALVDSQLARENITAAGIDAWASTETNDAGGNRDVLPLYTDLTANGSVINLCTNSDFDSGRDGNKLAEDRYIRLSVPVTDTYNVLVETTTIPPVTADPDDRDQSDPDVFVYRDGTLVAVGQSADDNVESFVTQNVLLAGEIYAVYVEEWRFEDEDGAPANYPEQICFDVSFTATP